MPPRNPEALLCLLMQDRRLRCIAEPELRALVQNAAVEIQLEREPIFGQGEPSSSVYAVVEGYVKLSSSTAAGREVVLEIAGPGSVFGEIGVLNEWPRAADATTLSRCKLLVIQGPQFRRVLQTSPEAMIEIIKDLCERLRRATEQMTDGVDLPASARLAKALIQLAGLHSHETPSGLRIDLNLSQRELGGLTGLTRESINKHLSSWQARGIVKLADGAIELTGLPALRDVATGA